MKTFVRAIPVPGGGRRLFVPGVKAVKVGVLVKTSGPATVSWSGVSERVPAGVIMRVWFSAVEGSGGPVDVSEGGTILDARFHVETPVLVDHRDVEYKQVSGLSMVVADGTVLQFSGLVQRQLSGPTKIVRVEEHPEDAYRMRDSTAWVPVGVTAGVVTPPSVFVGMIDTSVRGKS